MSEWHLVNGTEAEHQAFPTLEKAWNQSGVVINDNLMSRLTCVQVEGKIYYLKAYKKRGKSLRRYLGRSRVRAEWENLQILESIGIPTLRLVAYGEASGQFGDRKGALVTSELQGVEDLASLHKRGAPLLQHRQWMNHVIDRLSGYVRKMHDEKFIHGDLKWRNILVDSASLPEVYIFDCPLGRRVRSGLLSPIFKRGILKDLACLDKMAKYALSRTQRLRFYLGYLGKNRLDQGDKKQIPKILKFFEGRE